MFRLACASRAPRACNTQVYRYEVGFASRWLSLRTVGLHWSLFYRNAGCWVHTTLSLFLTLPPLRRDGLLWRGDDGMMESMNTCVAPSVIISFCPSVLDVYVGPRLWALGLLPRAACTEQRFKMSWSLQRLVATTVAEIHIERDAAVVEHRLYDGGIMYRPPARNEA